MIVSAVLYFSELYIDNTRVAGYRFVIYLGILCIKMNDVAVGIKMRLVILLHVIYLHRML